MAQAQSDSSPANSANSSRVIRTPDQRLRVFISSTLQELADERRAAKEAVTRLRLSPVMFELGARPHPARELYRAYLDQSHIFVGIYWQKYGWTAPDMDISGLEDEYRLSGGKPKLMYVKMPAPDREAKLKSLLDDIKNDSVSYKPFASAVELQQLIEDDLSLLLTERFEAALQEDQAAASTAPARIDNLPAVSNSLVGREHDIDDISALLLRGEVRLVTLTGPGGIGKTRLSIEVGRRVSPQFKDGVCFVPLATALTSEEVLVAVARALNLQGSGTDTLRDVHQQFDRIVSFLRERQLLLVLDNFEQVMEATTLVSDLLAAAPALELIITSREALRLNSEFECAVHPLPVPASDGPITVESLASNEAAKLFVERATAAKPDFKLTNANATAVAEICRRLDGLPLAIELAAARVRLLPPQTLLARLDSALHVLTSGARDLPERQRTLRATMEWSFNLLHPDEQRLFARFAVFAGGCTLEAAEAVLNEPPVDNVLDVLTSLADKSLIQQTEVNGEARLTMLQIIQEFANEKLEASGEAARLRHKHAEYYGALMQLATAETATGVREMIWQAQLVTEQANLRAALQWTLSEGDAAQIEAAAAHAWTLWQLWVAHANLREWQQWLETMLAKLPEDSAGRAKALALSGAMAVWQGDTQRGVPLLEQGVALFEKVGDRTSQTNALMMLGLALLNMGQLERAGQVLQQGLDLS